MPRTTISAPRSSELYFSSVKTEKSSTGAASAPSRVGEIPAGNEQDPHDEERQQEELDAASSPE